MLHDPRPPHLLRKAAEAKALRPQEHAAGWTAERIDLLKKRWIEGASATEIALELGGGATRSGVIGKVHRMKMGKARAAVAAPANPKRSGNKGQPKAAAIAHRVAMRPAIVPIPEPAEEGVDVTHLLGLTQLNEHTCKWPHGDPLLPDFGFCGEHTQEGSSYCPKHHRLAHLRAPA